MLSKRWAENLWKWVNRWIGDGNATWVMDEDPNDRSIVDASRIKWLLGFEEHFEVMVNIGALDDICHASLLHQADPTSTFWNENGGARVILALA